MSDINKAGRKKDEDFTNIRIHKQTHAELNSIGKRGESMDDIVRKCLEAHKNLGDVRDGKSEPTDGKPVRASLFVEEVRVKDPEVAKAMKYLVDEFRVSERDAIGFLKVQEIMKERATEKKVQEKLERMIEKREKGRLR